MSENLKFSSRRFCKVRWNIRILPETLEHFNSTASSVWLAVLPSDWIDDVQIYDSKRPAKVIKFSVILWLI